MTNEPYHPRPSDIEWAQRVMSMLKDGCPMRMPGPNMTYRKLGNKFVLIQGDPESECHQSTIAVFEAAGFVVEVAHEPVKQVRAELRRGLTDPDAHIYADEAGMREIAEMLTPHPERN